jgi:hypothetical protein
MNRHAMNDTRPFIALSPLREETHHSSDGNKFEARESADGFTLAVDNLYGKYFRS